MCFPVTTLGAPSHEGGGGGFSLSFELDRAYFAPDPPQFPMFDRDVGSVYKLTIRAVLDGQIFKHSDSKSFYSNLTARGRGTGALVGWMVSGREAPTETLFDGSWGGSKAAKAWTRIPTFLW